MKIVRMERGKGKTTDLIRLSAKTGVPIVCATVAQSDIILAKAEKMGLVIAHPIPANKIKEYEVSKVYVDDMEYVLSTLLQSTVEVATVSCDIEIK